MWRRQHAVLSMFLFWLLFASTSPAWGQAPAQFSDVVIFATNSVSLGLNTRVASGSVVVNDASNGPTLRGNAELSIDQNGSFAGDLAADTIVLDKKNSVAGAIHCNDGTGVSCGGLFLPVFAEEELPEIRLGVLAPGAADVAAPAHGQINLAAGSYADVTAGNGATIVFTGGVYNIGSILAGNDVSLFFTAPAELRILGKLGMGNNAFIGPGTGGAASASTIEVLVGGTNLDPNDPLSLPAAAGFSNNATLEAFVYAPFGTLRVKNNAVGKGVFAGRDVQAGNNARFVLSGANPAPTADPQTVFTSDTTPLPITLTGSDPGDDPLTFSIVSGPMQGSLSAVAQNPPDQATVTYTAAQTGALEDSFTFRVTDPGGAFDEAVVLINPVDNPVPPEPTGTVIGQDDSVEGIVNTELAITLIGVPDVEDSASVGDLEFKVVSGPSFGELVPNPPAPVSEPPASVRSARTNYLPDPDFEGADSFDFEVCGDLNGDLDTADVGECDTATISITVNPFVPPEEPEAPPVESRSVLTQIDVPVEIELAAVTGGSEGPGGGRPGFTAGPAARSFSKSAADPGRNNPEGPALKATELTVDGGWTFFNDCAIGSPCPAGPFTFAVTGSAACVNVTDAFLKSDEYSLADGAQSLGATSPGVPDDSVSQADADLAFADPAYSSGTFAVGFGAHAIAVTRTTGLPGLAAAFIRVDSPGTSYCTELPNLTVTAFSAPAAADLGEVIGDRILVTLTNTGTADIPAETLSSIGFYVSTDDLITTDDTLLIGGRENLATSTPNGLAVGESISDFLFAGASINAASPEGNVYIGVVADEFDTVVESDETDNTAAEAILIGAPRPDLVVASLTHEPAAPVVEAQIVFTAVVENAGAASAQASTLCFQIGGESCASPETLFSVPALEVDETFAVDRTVVLPAANYQNTAIADVAGTVDESDEENNTAFDTYTVAGPGDGLFATILALPQLGTLLDQNGLAITSLGPITGTRVTYVPAAGSAVPVAFQFTLTDAATGLTSLVARVDLFFAVVLDPCALVGRPPGCMGG